MVLLKSAVLHIFISPTSARTTEIELTLVFVVVNYSKLSVELLVAVILVLKLMQSNVADKFVLVRRETIAFERSVSIVTRMLVNKVLLVSEFVVPDVVLNTV